MWTKRTKEDKITELDRIIDIIKTKTNLGYQFVCHCIDYKLHDFPELDQAIQAEFAEDEKYDPRETLGSGYAMCFNKYRVKNNMKGGDAIEDEVYNKLKVNFLRRVKRSILKAN